MYTIETNDFFKVIVASPLEILDSDFRIRHQHFCTRKHDSADELQVIFFNGVLYFPDFTPKQDITRFSKLFTSFAKQKYVNGKRQEARFKAIVDRFGKDGENTAIEMFAYYKVVVAKE